ncbi:MAG: tRNA-binding protein [Nanoarchaeota archaeon]
MKETVSYADFDKVDIRVGRIIEVEEFHEARKPSYKLTIDFGPEIGIKKSSAQLKLESNKDELRNRLVIAVVNFQPKKIGPFTSEVLTLGVPGSNGGWVVVSPINDVEIGGKLT